MIDLTQTMMPGASEPLPGKFQTCACFPGVEMTSAQLFSKLKAFKHNQNGKGWSGHFVPVLGDGPDALAKLKCNFCDTELLPGNPANLMKTHIRPGSGCVTTMKRPQVTVQIVESTSAAASVAGPSTSAAAAPGKRKGQQDIQSYSAVPSQRNQAIKLVARCIYKNFLPLRIVEVSNRLVPWARVCT